MYFIFQVSLTRNLTRIVPDIYLQFQGSITFSIIKDQRAKLVHSHPANEHRGQKTIFASWNKLHYLSLIKCCVVLQLCMRWVIISLGRTGCRMDFHLFRCKVKDLHLSQHGQVSHPSAGQWGSCEQYLPLPVADSAHLASSNMLGHANSVVSGPYLPSVMHESALKT